MFRNRSASLKVSGLLLLPLVVSAQALAWGNSGHRAVVAVALQLDPSLRARINAVMKNLPSSPEWQALEATKLIKPNPFETEKGDPDGWVKSLATDPERAGTFADWARDYNGYRPKQLDMIHFYDLDYADGGTRFVDTPNALTALPGIEDVVAHGTGGSRAWALAWLLHIVGDLHQPLHTTAREVPGSHGKSDHGGNSAMYGSTKLHSWWDHLPDTAVGHDADAYAKGLYIEFKQRPAAERAAFAKQVKDVKPADWTVEGRKEITTIGYPTDQKVSDYLHTAKDVANRRILMGGARLAYLLNKLLPKNQG